MEKYARVLIIIFFLSIFNLGLNIYILSKINKPVVEKQVQTVIPTQTASPSATVTTPPNIQSDLTVIKAELRALRESLESNGLILQTPEP